MRVKPNAFSLKLFRERENQGEALVSWERNWRRWRYYSDNLFTDEIY